MFYCILNTSNIIITSFACSQLPTTQPGYAEIPDDDPRVSAWATAQLPNPIPQTVTAYQALMVLNNANLYSPVMAYIATQPVPTQIRFNKQANFTRTDATLNAAATALGLTPDQVDNLFIAAKLVID